MLFYKKNLVFLGFVLCYYLEEQEGIFKEYLTTNLTEHTIPNYLLENVIIEIEEHS